MQVKSLCATAALTAFVASGLGCSTTPSHASDGYQDFDGEITAADIRADDTPWLYSQTMTYEENINRISQVQDYSLRLISDDIQRMLMLDRKTQLVGYPFIVAPKY